MTHTLNLLIKINLFITFNIDSGNKYFFGDFKLNLPNDFDKKKFLKLDKIFEDLKDQTYNISEIEGIINEIENISLQENYEFINADIVENKTNNRIDFEINIKETENIYVSRINILGNNITSEEFIRDQLIVDEGDPFNKILYNKTINNIRSTGIFKSVLSEIKKDDTNQNIIDIIVEEKPTGEITAGAGYGSDGSSFSFGIRENNFNGQGIELETNLSLSEDSIKGLFSYIPSKL
jgi:outer membrane protein insertion porin family